MDALICDGVRTPIGRYGGVLSSVRTDDLAALPIMALIHRNANVDWSRLDEVVLGCANQAGEDNRNVARMATLLAGLPAETPALTVNRLCASGMDAVTIAARGVRSGDYDLMIAGGVESMSRAPFVLPKSQSAFSRVQEIHDTTIGWRFVNPKIDSAHGTHSMPETADNVADEFNVSRRDQDRFAMRSQSRWAAAHEAGFFRDEIVAVRVPRPKGGDVKVTEDEHPRPGTTAEGLAKLNGINGRDRSVTAGNSSGINDGAAAILISSETGARDHGLTPVARVVGMASAGVLPRVMGVGPVPACRKVLDRAGLSIDQIDVIELNEAFASQGLATLRQLGVADDDERVNPNGGAIALGHPLGMSGTRIVLTAARQLQRIRGKYALCTMCVGVGQGTAVILERV